MPDFDWNVRSLTRSMPETQVGGAANESSTLVPAPAEAPHNGGDTSGVRQHATTISLHPGLRLIIEDNLRGAALDAHNLCVVVGTAKRDCWKDGTERTTQTPFGSTQASFRLDVQEVVGDESGAALSSYSMPLNVSSRLLETGVLIDGQRVAVSGPLRLERTYDRQFASDDLDPGLPVWDIRLDVITVQAITTDDIPDGSWVQLEGEIAGDPLIRFRAIGPREVVPFASVRLRYRRPLHDGFARSRAVYSTSVLVPLEVALDGIVEQAGALLLNGNVVRIEGRLAPYEVRRRPAESECPADQQQPPTPQQSTPRRVAEALSRLETRMRAQGGAHLDRRIRAAKQRMLTIVQRAVSVGYVELRRGTHLSDDEIAALIATHPRRARRPRWTTRRAPRAARCWQTTTSHRPRRQKHRPARVHGGGYATRLWTPQLAPAPMNPEIPLTLVGAISVWKQRLCADTPGAAWITWLRHPAHGTLGIYVLPKPIAMGEALPDRTWVCVRGLLRPLRVMAVEDADPRSERNSAQVPLLLHATSITVCEHTTPMPSLARHQIHVRPGRWIGVGHLAPTHHLPDLVCFVPTKQHGRCILTWNHPYGVLARVGQRHYLRYVLMHTRTDC